MKRAQRFSSDQTHGRLFGLGQSPSNDTAHTLASQALTCGFTQVPVIEYVTWTVELPQLDPILDSTFGDEIDVLTNPKVVPGVTSVDSSFIMNGLLQVDMIVVGFGIHVFGEPEAGTIIGNGFNFVPPDGASPVSPDAFTVQDTLVSLGLLEGQTITPALLEWGAPTWNAMWHLVNGYQFQWIMQQRYALIQELAADVAYFGPYADGVASGTSQEAVQRFARRTNDRYQSLGFPGVFEPINAQRVGSVTTLNTTNTGVYHPTRAYDEMNMTWGGIGLQGRGFSGGQFRRLIRPVLLEKGIPIGMKLQVQDEYHQTEMHRYMSISDSQGGLNNTVAYASGSGGLTVAGAGIFPELTLDATSVLADQQVQTNRQLFKGGTMKLAILVKGFEVWGQWKDYIAQNLIPSGVVSTPSTGVGLVPGR